MFLFLIHLVLSTSFQYPSFSASSFFSRYLVFFKSLTWLESCLFLVPYPQIHCVPHLYQLGLFCIHTRPRVQCVNNSPALNVLLRPSTNCQDSNSLFSRLTEMSTHLPCSVCFLLLNLKSWALWYDCPWKWPGRIWNQPQQSKPIGKSPVPLLHFLISLHDTICQVLSTHHLVLERA